MNANAIFSDALQSSQFDSFYKKIKNLKLDLNYKIFKDAALIDEIKTIADGSFHDYILQIHRILNDPYLGISVTDIVKYVGNNEAENAFYESICALAITWNVLAPSIEPVNRTPFTIYTASKSNAIKLHKENLDHNIPEVKLGFHNDGLFEGDKFLIPNTIGLYNMHIAYRNPGSFHWVPWAAWSEYDKYSELFELGKRYNFKIVQNAYSKNDGIVKVNGKDSIIAPMFSMDKTGRKVFFLNGEVITDEQNIPVDLNLINEMKNSIYSSNRISVKQLPGRLILLANSHGCHARDIFEDPIEGSAYTRVFMRSVDTKGIIL